MGGVMGLVFGALVVLCAVWWGVRRWCAARQRPLCPECIRWHEDTCSVPERPEVTRCRLFVPYRPLGPLESTEDGTVSIDWDWEDGV